MGAVNNEMVLLKEQMLRSADKLRVLFNNDFQKAECFELFFDHVSAYFRIQSDEFYKNLRSSYGKDQSSFKKIDFLENDLKVLKVRLYDFYESFGQPRSGAPKALAVRQLKLLIKDVNERIKLEEDFLHPFLV